MVFQVNVVYDPTPSSVTQNPISVASCCVLSQHAMRPIQTHPFKRVSVKDGADGGGWRMADGGWRMADGGWQTADDG